MCKPGGKILLLESGLPSLIESHKVYQFKAGMTLRQSGYFCDRDWEKIVEGQQGFSVISKERKVNGTYYIYVLENSAKQTASAPV